MKKKLTIPLVLACGLSLAISQAQTPDEPLEEIIVTGEFAGPGMLQVTHPDHPGHTLWIVGEPPLLPQGMRFHSQQVANVASQSQEIILQVGVSLKPDEKVGMFRMLTLVPAAMKLRKNPDKATLQELLPPDVYARWLVQKKLYLGRDSGVEKMRPFLVAEKLRDAAIKELQLGGGGAWGTIAQLVEKKKIPVTSPNLEFTFKTDDLRGQIKAASREKLGDEECFARTVELIEALSNKQVEDARARAWATGDLAKLQELPPLPNPDVACEQAIVNALAMTTAVPTNLSEQMDELWLAAAGSALTKNESTLALVPMSDLLGEQGYLESLRKRGYEILAPG
ncbi:MAG TPA: TraB/GumN family protein [Steroidobacteraceae bacterium]|nr:TraB/GumN family protein [Steroidobacteraceae bacterium]